MVHLVQPDGSCIRIRYDEPLNIIKLPVNVALLSEEERRLLLTKRKPKSKVIIAEEFNDDFDGNKYLNFKKK